MTRVCPIVPKPTGVAALPVDHRGYPIFFGLGANADGSPDWRSLDPQKVVQCVRQRLCHICGRSLVLVGAFLGGPTSAQTGVFSEPPGHPTCMEYAAKVCPFLGRAGWDRSHTSLAAEAAVKDPLGDITAWEAVVLYVCSEWQPFKAPGGAMLFKAGAPRRVTVLVESPKTDPS